MDIRRNSRQFPTRPTAETREREIPEIMYSSLLRVPSLSTPTSPDLNVMMAIVVIDVLIVYLE